MSARFSNHSGNTHHSLNALFAQLDAFKIRFSTLSTLAQPQYSLCQPDFKGFTDNWNFEPSLAGYDNTQGTAHLGQSLGQAAFDIGDWNPAEKTTVASATNHGCVPALSNASNTTTAAFQKELENRVEMNGHSLQPSNDPQAMQGWDYSDLLLPAQNIAANLPNVDAVWDNMINPGPKSTARAFEDLEAVQPQATNAQQASTNLQGLENVGSPALNQGQDMNVLPASTNELPATTPAPLTTASRHNLRHRCPSCSMDFSRRSDRNRHALSHDPHARRFPCPDPRCSSEFPRKDKLLDHRRRMRH